MSLSGVKTADANGKSKKSSKYVGISDELPQMVVQDTETEFEKYRIIQDRLFESDFDKYLGELPFDEDGSKQIPTSSGSGGEKNE